MVHSVLALTVIKKPRWLEKISGIAMELVINIRFVFKQKSIVPSLFTSDIVEICV